MRVAARLVLAAVIGGAAGSAVAAPSLAAFGHLPSVDLVAVSPDGSKIAMVVGDDVSRQLQVRRTADSGVVRLLNFGKVKLRALQWDGESHLLITRSAAAEVIGLTGPKREYSLASDLNLVTGKQQALLGGAVDDVREKLNTVASLPMPRIIDGHAVVFVEGTSFPSNEGVLTLFRIDLDAGNRTRVVAVGDSATRAWLVDAAGTVVARTDYIEASGRWTLYTGRGRLVRSMTETRPLDSPWLAGLGRTPGTVMVGFPDDDTTSYREVVVGTDTMSDAVGELAGGDLIPDPKTGQVIGMTRDTDLDADYHFLSAADRALWAKVARGFGKAVVHLESWSDDRQVVVLRVAGKDVGAAYYLLDVATRHASWLANEYAELDPADLGDKQAFRYKAADGLEIPAYLTLPPGRGAKGLPLVVLAHGGPSARDDPGFDWWAQALASRGYAVLQPQFRGSAGFGESFLTAGYGEWGRKMQTDLSDGVAHLAKAGTIDPARVCIVGGSYGGYAALAGVTLQHGIYRCAVSLAGPADLKLMLDYERTITGGAKNSTLRHWQRFMGAKSPTDPMLATISPLTKAASADAPVLLIHGTDDTVVPFEQSKVMAAALTRAGKPVELVRLASEDHWLSRSATRAAMLNATVTFLTQHLPAGSAATTAAAP